MIYTLQYRNLDLFSLHSFFLYENEGVLQWNGMVSRNRSLRFAVNRTCTVTIPRRRLTQERGDGEERDGNGGGGNEWGGHPVGEAQAGRRDRPTGRMDP
jgi:hypothetical protein